MFQRNLEGIIDLLGRGNDQVGIDLNECGLTTLCGIKEKIESISKRCKTLIENMESREKDIEKVLIELAEWKEELDRFEMKIKLNRLERSKKLADLMDKMAGLN